MRALFILMFLALSLPALAATQPVPGKKPSFAQTVCTRAEKEADANGIDKAFLIRLLYKESLFNPNAVSHKGAQGLAQFMPETAKRVGLDDPFDPEQAISASARFLRTLKNEFGNLGLAAAAYNSGEQRVRNWLAGKGGMPLETQDYVAFITGKEVAEWRESSATHAIPAIGKSDSFAKNCVQLASRTRIVVGKRVVRRAGLPATYEKPKPWGSMLTADFSETRALAMFNRLKLRFPGKLGTQRPMVVRKKNLSRGTRAIAAVMLGANSQQEAIAKCRSLVSDGIPCVVRKN